MLLKIDSGKGVFLLNFAKHFVTAFLENTCERLLLSFDW